MNTNYDLNLTPKTNNQSKYVETLMEFSTPMSTISDDWINDTTIKDFKKFDDKIFLDYDSDSTIVNDKPIDTISNDNNNETDVLEKLLQKFNEHKLNFQNTQYYLSVLDDHICEIKIILNQLQNLLCYNSSFKKTIDQLETRLLQISTKREQIRKTTNNFHTSSTLNRKFNDTVQQIPPRASTLPTKTDDMIHCIELIVAAKQNLNQQANLIEYLHHEKSRIKQQTDNFYSSVNRRQQLLMTLVDKVMQQQNANEKSIETLHIDKPQFNNHREQLAVLDKLTEEYQMLQDENSLLKCKIKDNIQTLYNSINLSTE